MVELLIGRWQSYQFTIRGAVTKTNGVLIKIEASGKVHYSYFNNGKWNTDAVERTVVEEHGKLYITEPGRKLYLVVSNGQHYLQLGVVENYAEPVLVYHFNKLPNKN